MSVTFSLSIHLRQMSIDNKRSFEQAYLFNDYWEDIGTIRSFFEANLALTEHVRTNLSSKILFIIKNIICSYCYSRVYTF